MSNHRRHDESPTEFAERQERAEAEASRWFNDLAAAQIAIFNERMATAREFKGVPRWDRVRDAAKREFERTTVEASRVAAMVRADMMAAGEVSEATSYAFDEAKVSQTMAAECDHARAEFPAITEAAIFPRVPSYEEAKQDAAKARFLFNLSKGGNVRGITENDRFVLADVFLRPAATDRAALIEALQAAE